MNTEENKPVAPAPAKPVSPILPDDVEVEDAIDFLKENGVAIVIGVALVVAGFVGYTAWKSSKAAREEAASSMLANAQSVPQLQEIVNSYSDTKAAPMAYLSLASAYYDQGQYDLARQTFNQFQTTYPDHSMAAVADLGIAQVLDAVGNTTEALAAYDAFLAKHPGHYQAPSATFGKARVLESMGRFDEARTVYEDFIAAHPDSRWISRAETGLDFVNKQQRAATGNPQPAAPTSAPAPETP